MKNTILSLLLASISVSADQIITTSIEDDEKCTNPNAEIISYHIHALFWASSAISTQKAMDLQQAFYDKFELHNTPNCTVDPGDPAPQQTWICPF